MDILQAIILGIVQGVTEWLPISSKSHLLIFQRLFDLSPPLIFDLILHMGSLLVVIIVFWKDVKKLILGIIKQDKEQLKLLLYIILATIPIALAGFLLENLIKSIFYDLRVLGFGFLFSALIIFLSRYPKTKNKLLNAWNSFIIGISQIIALFPGVSRSGTTISTGMILGIKKEDVAKFSFLIFLPAILGATILEFKDIGQIDNILPVLLGTVAAVISGFLTLKLLLNIIKKNKFSYFSIYCLILGIIVLIFAYA